MEGELPPEEEPRRPGLRRNVAHVVYATVPAAGVGAVTAKGTYCLRSSTQEHVEHNRETIVDQVGSVGYGAAQKIPDAALGAGILCTIIATAAVYKMVWDYFRRRI